MKTITKFICILITVFSFNSFSQPNATYTITFNSEWNASNHGTMPDDVHWSKLVGANHNSAVSFWELNQTASLGIEDVSEIGNNTAFNTEIIASISEGNTQQYITGSNLNSALGMIVIDVEVSEDYPLLTLASMIAPSPDWFIGVNNLSLLDEEGNWLETITLDMFVYDAGTEDGNTYSYDNSPTNPQGVISSKVNVAPFNDQRIGTLTITLQNILSIEDTLESSHVSLFPNPTTGLVTIKSEEHLIQDVSVFNILGQEVSAYINESNKSHVTLDLKALKKGIYLVRIITDNPELVTKRLVLK